MLTSVGPSHPLDHVVSSHHPPPMRMSRPRPRCQTRASLGSPMKPRTTATTLPAARSDPRLLQRHSFNNNSRSSRGRSSLGGGGGGGVGRRRTELLSSSELRSLRPGTDHHDPPAPAADAAADEEEPAAPSSSDNFASTRGSTTTAMTRGLRDAGTKGTVPTYTMSALDNAALGLFRRALVAELELPEDPEKDGGFPGTMRLVRELQRRSGSAEELQGRGGRVLRGLLPPWLVGALAATLRALPPWFVARHASAFTALAVNWLVGPCAVNDAPGALMTDSRAPVPPSAAAAVMGAPTEPSGYRQGVLVQRCRVLEETKCASVCLNVCQIPTQRFFTEDVGLPMTMLPDYDTFECQFVFGRLPPPPPDSDIYDTPCFKQCSAATRSAKQCDLKPFLTPEQQDRILSDKKNSDSR